MTTGFFLYHLDKTTCGGRILSGAEDETYEIGGIERQQVREGDPVTCGKHPGRFRVCGGMGDTYEVGGVMREWAGSLDSYSSCPCRAKFIPFVETHTYESNCNAGRVAEREQAVKRTNPPTYQTGEKTKSGFVPDYPVLRNTQDFPDEKLRGTLAQNNQDVMLLTLPEAFEVLQSWGWNDTKTVWVEATQSDVGQVLVNYGVNGKDVVTTSMIVSKLGSFGIKATVYINHKGTELIKLTGYPGIRKVLNAPVFALKNPKVVDLGIGKYGLGKSIIEGARLTFYFAAAYRTIDFILNDETHLAQFIGSLATDVAKIGIASAISWGIGVAAVAYVPFIAVPLVVVVGIGLFTAWGLNELDNKFGITDKVVAYIEASQQEFVEKARGIEQGLWDLGAMYAEKMLDKGKEVIESEVRRYIRESLKDIIPRIN
ncbi:PAAR domain-containing protein [Erwinia sp. HR93]|uniref:PAAR domain-containing protein n=1 Tax=Erwinia sp. HR93 TaxID=3094840 RepID=UPI002ADEC7F5|nr:PAAR domain-containing protein [Erwinia sp. HR93]MEA1063514.1 PAAR domain-containing protein [Erwinia sp. HR93]